VDRDGGPLCVQKNAGVTGMKVLVPVKRVVDYNVKAGAKVGSLAELVGKLKEVGVL
jgi:hypothetical protein